jgi:hypothetical protein
MLFVLLQEVISCECFNLQDTFSEQRLTEYAHITQHQIRHNKDSKLWSKLFLRTRVYSLSSILILTVMVRVHIGMF